MIFVRDKGQMCNNILQYAHLYAWGREHQVRTVSMRFAYKYRYFKICSTPWHNFFVYLMAKWGAGIGIIPKACFHKKGGDTSAQEAMMKKKKLVVAEGWEVAFPDLFLKYRSEIVSLFAFKEEISGKIRKYVQETAPADSIKLGIHIRRGDYARWNGGRYFFEDEVYISLIRQFAALFPDKRIVVYLCSNDNKVNATDYRMLSGIDNVYRPDGNPAEDLCLLSLCDYVIGAPSTFSLVASLYRDIPLYWIEDKDEPLSLEVFKKFDYLFTRIR